MFPIPLASEGEDLFSKFSARTSVKFLTDAVLLRHGSALFFFSLAGPTESQSASRLFFPLCAMDPDTHLWAISSSLFGNSFLELVSKVPEVSLEEIFSLGGCKINVT